MDPFSITVGIVGLVDGGLSIAGKLKDLIHTYRHAEQELVELAHEIDLTISLIGILGDNLDQPENAYPKKIVHQTKTLINDIQKVFDDIEIIVKKYDYSASGSAGYVLRAGDLKAHQAKIKGLQLSFVFMLSVCPPQRYASQGSGTVGTTNAGGQGQLGSFEGTIQQFPIDFNDHRGNPNQGTPVTYQATLTLRPSNGPNLPPGIPSQGAQGNKQTSPTLTDTLEAARKDKELKKKLANLSRSPFFPTDFFSPIAHKLKKRPKYTEAATYEEVVTISKSSRERERRKEETQQYEEMKRREEMKRMEKEEASGVRMPTSREAKSTVNNIFEYLLDDSDSDSESEVEIVDAVNARTGEAFKVEVIPAPADDYHPPQQSEEGHRRRPSKSKSGSKSPAASDRRSPSTGSGTQRPLPGSYPPESDTRPSSDRGFRCDGCEQKYGNVSRYKCALCKDFDFCQSCFDDPKKTLRHQHAKPDFIPIIKG